MKFQNYGFILLITVVFFAGCFSSEPEEETQEPLPAVTWDIDDATSTTSRGYTINASTTENNVLLRVELTNGKLPLNKVTWQYSVGNMIHKFSLVDVGPSGGSCGSEWSTAEGADGDSDGANDLFDANDNSNGWDSDVTCIQAGDEDGNFEVGEFFFILEDVVEAPVDPGDFVTLKFFWNNDQKLYDKDFDPQ